MAVPEPVPPSAGPGEKSVTPLGLMHLSVVYLVWGSTYLAIRIVVREGSGFPPFSMGFLRMAAAGIFLLLWAGASRHKIRLSLREYAVLAVSGVLLWGGGNGLVVWAEQHAESSLAALVVGTTPIWVAMMEALLDRKRPSGLLVLALLSGIAGLTLLSAPVFQAGLRADLTSVLALVGASISWAGGTIIQSRNPVSASPRVSSGYQHLFGILGFTFFLLLFPEPWPDPRPDAWLAWGYLVLFGSVLAFTSFVHVLQLLPVDLVTTYAYVNPVIAVILGVLVLQEQISGWTLAGASLVILGVAGVFRSRRIARKRALRMPGLSQGS